MISAAGIKVYSYLNITAVADFFMEIKPGEHGRVTLRGYLAGMPDVGRLQEEAVRIMLQEDGDNREQVLFHGIIQSVHTFVENGVCQVILSALTSSIRLDQEERNRSFQKTKETYLGIMREVAGNVSGSGLSVETGVPVIQYRETDWEFCRRMAAGAGQVLYADPASPEIRLWAGLEEKGGTASFPADRYSVCVDETYYHMKSAGEGKKEFLYYRTESWENYEIGESSFYQGQRRYIFEKTAELVGGVLVFGYKLGGKCRFGQKRYANRKMAGVSLRGTVEKREKESVYLKLDIDGADGKALHPYPWIPPTGNVMYCMPQEGTEAYLYFPEAEEGSAYAVSGIHNSSCPIFADARNRGLVTEHGKEMWLYADMLGFAGGKEETVQECRMGEDGIHFSAGKGKLQVTGSGQITFRAPEISLDAVQKIGQYKMESMAKEKAGMLYSGGNGNPSTGGGGDGAAELQNEYNALSSQGILAGTEYEYYKPFDDAPEYEEYKEVPTWLKAVAGAVVAAVVGLAVGALVVATGGLAAAALGVTAVQLGMTAGVLTAGAGFVAVAATAASDKKNGTESSLRDYTSNAFWASARVGGSCIAITLGMYGAEVMTMTVSGGLGLIPVGGTVVTLPQLAGAFLLVAGTVTSQNLLFQMREVLMFCISGKEMGAPTGNWLYDSARELTEMASMQFAAYGLRNPYTYQRPKITPLPNETGLTVPGGTGVAVVPNGTAPALKQPYLPGQYTEYPAAVQGWAQQALPGGGSGIEGDNKIKIQAVIPPGSTHPVKVYTDGNAQINIGKIDTYIRGKVELDVEATITRIDELKDIRKLNPESFTKEMKKELQECENRLHNYQRSQEMNNTLNEAGIEDSIENNQMIVENLLDAAKEVTDGNTEIISYIEGVNGKVQVVSRWKILPDGTPYLATVILKPMK